LSDLCIATFYGALRVYAPIHNCDRTTSEMRGPSSEDRSGDSRQSKNAQTHIRSMQNMIKVEIRLLQPCFKDYKIEKQKML
jgi:hypothetical protein